MDISDTLAPNSDQLDAIELAPGPRTFTIERVSKGTAEQPVNIHLADFPRPWRPGKTMRRVLVGAWGADASQYVGRRVTLFCDQSVMFGKEKVGGTRISHMSHLDGPTEVQVLLSRGKPGWYKVQPLQNEAPAPPEPTAEQVAACTDPATLRAWWKTSGPDRRAQIEARGAELEKPADEPEPGLNFPEGGA